MAAPSSLGQPNSDEWRNILNQLDHGEFKDRVIYRIGLDVFSAYRETVLPQNCEIITRDRILEIIDPKTSISSATYDPILVSKERRAKYFDLNKKPSWLAKFKQFEKDLDILLSSVVHENFKSDISTFVATYKEKYKIDASDFEALFIDKSDLNVREKLLNKVFNRFKNEDEIRAFIEGRKKEIIAEFAKNDHRATPAEKFTFDVEYIGKETHNQGKLPAKIVFKLAGDEVFTVIYKPREALVDKAVQELFVQLGLPSYKIISYHDEHASVWEYIHGKDMVLSDEERRSFRFSRDKRFKSEGVQRTPEAYIRHSSTLQDNQRGPLLEKLSHLNNVLLAIEASDLHGENVRLGQDGNIYPIDLEVMDHRQPTMMMIDDYFDETAGLRKGAWEKLATKAQKISEWQSQLKANKGFPIRHVLVTTGKLVPFSAFADTKAAAVQITAMIGNALQFRGYTTTPSQKIIIQNRTYIDLLNGDVPFFTELDDVIYYGHANENCQIGSILK